MLKSKTNILRALTLAAVSVVWITSAHAQSKSQSSSASTTKLYKWTDEDGKVHYSERLPQEAVGKATTHMSRQGTVVKETDRALTPEERFARQEAARKREEEMKLYKEEERKNVAVLS